MMFKVGDHVFYPKGGVFVIANESDKLIGGNKIPFFDLVSCDEKTKISIPKENVVKVGVRPLLTSEALDTCILEWGPDLKISKLHHKNRKSKFEIMRQTGNFEDMGLVVVTIHYLVKKAKATFEEKRMYDQIRKRLQDEIEIVKNWDKTRAEAHLISALDEAIDRKPVRTIEDVLGKGKGDVEVMPEEELEEVFG